MLSRPMSCKSSFAAFLARMLEVLYCVFNFDDYHLSMFILDATHIMIRKSSMKVNAWWQFSFDELELFPTNSEGIEVACYFVSGSHSLQDNAGSEVALLTGWEL